jgi:hypothetical protein
MVGRDGMSNRRVRIDAARRHPARTGRSLGHDRAQLVEPPGRDSSFCSLPPISVRVLAVSNGMLHGSRCLASTGAEIPSTAYDLAIP